MASLQSLPHDDLGPQFNAIVVVLVVLSGTFLFLRVYLKLKQRRGLWWDDYILILSWVGTSCFRAGARWGWSETYKKTDYAFRHRGAVSSGG
jgi:hypothetical protein